MSREQICAMTSHTQIGSNCNLLSKHGAGGCATGMHHRHRLYTCMLRSLQCSIDILV